MGAEDPGVKPDSEIARAEPDVQGRVGLARLAGALFVVGLTAYGGPAIVAQIRQAIVLKRRWLSEASFQETLAFCQTLPGPVAVQTAAHIGWRMHGGLGVLVALTAYTLPAFGLMLGLSMAYFRFGELPAVAALFRGLGAVVAAIVADSILSMAQPSLRDWRGVLIAGAAAAGFFTRQGVVPVLAAAALAGVLLVRGAAPPGGVGSEAAAGPVPARMRFRSTLAWVLILAAVFGSLAAAAGYLDPALPRLALAMIKVNLLAFGGGYTAVALMYQESVVRTAWLTPKAFVDGLAISQITPGPVIVTATFIGYHVGGLPAALLATFCVFWPSALLLTLLAPQFERIRRLEPVARAVRGLLAAFIAMLFAVFWQVGKASLTDLPTLLTAGAAFLLIRRKVNPIWPILAASAVWAVAGS